MNRLTQTLQPLAEPAYTLLRITAGLMFTLHGVQKVFGMLTDKAPPAIGSQLWIGGIIELVTGVAIAAGAWTSWAALLACGTMVVAYVQFHWKLDLGIRLLPIVNKGELAALYAAVFLLIACRGGGRFSVDGR